MRDGSSSSGPPLRPWEFLLVTQSVHERPPRSRDRAHMTCMRKALGRADCLAAIVRTKSPSGTGTRRMDIGFIGLGNMGFHMARRLIEAGHTLTVYDTRRAAIDRLVALGAAAAGSPREIADRLETVIASLPTPDIVLVVATGRDGVIAGKRVRRFIDTSTTGAEMASRIFTALKAKDIVQIDAPVSGGVSGAEKGTLAVMVSGPRAEVEAAEPALKVFGKVFFISERPG